MSEGRNSTPSWVPHLMGALLTVGATWTAIRTEVPGIVRNEVVAEMSAHTAAMMRHQDSLWHDARERIHAHIAAEAHAVRDSLQAALDLVEARPDRVTYAPKITVQQDSAATAVLHARLDTIQEWTHNIMRELVRSAASRKREGSRRGSDAWK